MAIDTKWLLDQRKLLNQQFIEIISKKESILTQDEELAEFCSTVTDYLTASVLKFGLTTNFDFATNFSDKYANGAKSWVELRTDLSKLIILIAEHWNNEDTIIKAKQATSVST